MDQPINNAPIASVKEVLPGITIDQPKKSISKKLFWTLITLSNIVPLLFLLVTLWGVFYSGGDGLALVGFLVIFFYTAPYIAFVSVILFLRKKAQDRKNFIILASIFICISICFVAYNFIADHYGSQYYDKVKVEAKEIVGPINSATNFIDCKSIGEKIQYEANRDALERCFSKVLYITKDLDACLDVARLTEFSDNLDYVYQEQCILSYAFITQDNQYCELLNTMQSKSLKKSPELLRSIIKHCEESLMANGFINYELSKVFSDIKNIEDCNKYTHEDIADICRDYIHKK